MLLYVVSGIKHEPLVGAIAGTKLETMKMLKNINDGLIIKTQTQSF